MVRIFIGAAVGGLIQFIIGAIAWATPLGRLAFSQADLPATEAIQQVLRSTLTATGTGTYFIPSPETARGTELLGAGPVALIHFNANGFPPMDPAALVTGLMLSILMLFLIGVALSLIDGFARRAQALMLIGVATTLYFVFTLPVYNPYMPWNWWVFLGTECLIAFVVGGLVMIRWFMPHRPEAYRAEPESAPPPGTPRDATPVL